MPSSSGLWLDYPSLTPIFINDDRLAIRPFKRVQNLFYRGEGKIAETTVFLSPENFDRFVMSVQFLMAYACSASRIHKQATFPQFYRKRAIMTLPPEFSSRGQRY